MPDAPLGRDVPAAEQLEAIVEPVFVRVDVLIRAAVQELPGRRQAIAVDVLEKGDRVGLAGVHDDVVQRQVLVDAGRRDDVPFLGEVRPERRLSHAEDPLALSRALDRIAPFALGERQARRGVFTLVVFGQAERLQRIAEGDAHLLTVRVEDEVAVVVVDRAVLVGVEFSPGAGRDPLDLREVALPVLVAVGAAEVDDQARRPVVDVLRGEGEV
ncbi:MAG: hypothetical protein ACREQJ_13585, partial [Candidatus Binatia bacterium]